MLEKYTDMLSFAFKNTHTISECLERMVREEKKKEREQTFSYWLSGRYATQLVQTTKRRRGGGEWDNPKNKKLSVENLEHFPKYTNFPDEHIS